MAELVAGVDGCKDGWVAVILLEGKFHAAHRIYHGLHDLGVHAGTGAMVASYGSALIGTLAAAAVLLKIGF